MTSALQKVGLLKTLLSRIRLAIRLMREPGVPIAAKVLPLVAAIYLVSPLDLVPDVFPILGQLDDLAIILGVLEMFLRLCPAAAVAFHESAIARRQRYAPMTRTSDVIDTEWRHE